MANRFGLNWEPRRDDGTEISDVVAGSRSRPSDHIKFFRATVPSSFPVETHLHRAMMLADHFTPYAIPNLATQVVPGSV